MRTLNRYGTENLTEVKAGQTGKGLLIEHDGHIIGNKDTISQIKEDIEHGSKFVIPDDFVVFAVFQKFGIKNANGRIYPENILKREVQKYLEDQVANHTAIGALDHPSCQLADTQILTEKGWKYITDVEVGENILTVTKEKKIEIKPILRKIAEPYKGRLIHLKGRFIDIKVTPNHKFPILDRYGNWKGFFTAQDILDKNIPEQDSSFFFKTEELSNKDFIYDGSEDKTFNFNTFSLSNEELSTIEEDYDGMVYCVEVENHTFYTMCNNGKCLWSGNSSTLSGHDVTHRILDLRWKGRTLVGEMKLHLSPGFRKHGVCSTSGDLVANMIMDGIQVGVSSRAVGSVENKLGVLIVGDDLSIIGWDVVIENSTPGALVKLNQDELEPFIESQGRDGAKMISEKIEKINKILL